MGHNGCDGSQASGPWAICSGYRFMSLQMSKVNGGLGLRSNETPAKSQAYREPYPPHVVPTTTTVICRDEPPLPPSRAPAALSDFAQASPTPSSPALPQFLLLPPKKLRQGNQKAIAGLKVF